MQSNEQLPSVDNDQPEEGCLSLSALSEKATSALPSDALWTHIKQCARCLRATATLAPEVLSRNTAQELAVVSQEFYIERKAFRRGGMYETRLARDIRTDRRVVLKEPPKDLKQSEKNLLSALLRREARILASLQHPSIVTLLEAGEWADGGCFYSMELVQGDTLKEAVDKTKSPRERLALLPAFIGVVDAVAYAHKKGIVHRDASPNNIIICGNSSVLIDWTTAKNLLPVEAQQQVLDAAELPDTGPTLGTAGTPGYSPPEQLNGAHDHRVDVFALGACLQFLVTGKQPFPGRSLDEIQSGIASGKRNPLSDTPSRLAAIIRKATAPNPVERYKTAEELGRALRDLGVDNLLASATQTHFHKVVTSPLFWAVVLSASAVLAGATAWSERGKRLAAESAMREDKARSDKKISELAEERRLKELQSERATQRAQEAVELADRRLTETKAARAKTVGAFRQAAQSQSLSEASRREMNQAIAEMEEATRRQYEAEEERARALQTAQERSQEAAIANDTAAAARLAQADAEGRAKAAETEAAALRSRLEATTAELEVDRLRFQRASNNLEMERNRREQELSAALQELRDAQSELSEAHTKLQACSTSREDVGP